MGTSSSSGINLAGAFGGIPVSASTPSPSPTPPPAPAPAPTVSAGFVYPATAFQSPGPSDYNLAYWNGYALAKSYVSLIPSPSGMADYWAYAAACAPLMKPPATNGYTGFPLAGNIGYNECTRDAWNYRWHNDPASPDFGKG